VRALLTDCTRKGFHTVRLLSAPDEKLFPSVRNVSKATDRPREEVPGLGSGWAARPSRKTDGLCPCLNNFGRYSDATYGSTDAITVLPYALTDETRSGLIMVRSHNRHPVRRPCGLNKDSGSMVLDG